MTTEEGLIDAIKKLEKMQEIEILDYREVAQILELVCRLLLRVHSDQTQGHRISP